MLRVVAVTRPRCRAAFERGSTPPWFPMCPASPAPAPAGRHCPVRPDAPSNAGTWELGIADLPIGIYYRARKRLLAPESDDEARPGGSRWSGFRLPRAVTLDHIK